MLINTSNILGIVSPTVQVLWESIYYQLKKRETYIYARNRSVSEGLDPLRTLRIGRHVLKSRDLQEDLC